MASKDFNDTVELVASIRRPVKTTIRQQNYYNGYYQYPDSGDEGPLKMTLRTENQHLDISISWPYNFVGCQITQLRLITATGLTFRRISVSETSQHKGEHVDITFVEWQMSWLYHY